MEIRAGSTWTRTTSPFVNPPARTPSYLLTPINRHAGAPSTRCRDDGGGGVIQRDGWTVVETFSDGGISGAIFPDERLARSWSFYTSRSGLAPLD
jgi:hypothetical protein